MTSHTSKSIAAWNGFSAGQIVIMDIETRGDTDNGDDVIYFAGTPATILDIEDLGPLQGQGVHVLIGQSERTIINTFDDADVRELGAVPFHAADQ